MNPNAEEFVPRHRRPTATNGGSQRLQFPINNNPPRRNLNVTLNDAALSIGMNRTAGSRAYQVDPHPMPPFHYHEQHQFRAPSQSVNSREYEFGIGPPPGFGHVGAPRGQQFLPPHQQNISNMRNPHMSQNFQVPVMTRFFPPVPPVQPPVVYVPVPFPVPVFVGNSNQQMDIGDNSRVWENNFNASRLLNNEENYNRESSSAEISQNSHQSSHSRHSTSGNHSTLHSSTTTNAGEAPKPVHDHGILASDGSGTSMGHEEEQKTAENLITNKENSENDTKNETSGVGKKSEVVETTLKSAEQLEMLGVQKTEKSQTGITANIETGGQKEPKNSNCSAGKAVPEATLKVTEHLKSYDGHRHKKANGQSKLVRNVSNEGQEEPKNPMNTTGSGEKEVPSTSDADFKKLDELLVVNTEKSSSRKPRALNVDSTSGPLRRSGPSNATSNDGFMVPKYTASLLNVSIDAALTRHLHLQSSSHGRQVFEKVEKLPTQSSKKKKNQKTTEKQTRRDEKEHADDIERLLKEAEGTNAEAEKEIEDFAQKMGKFGRIMTSVHTHIYTLSGHTYQRVLDRLPPYLKRVYEAYDYESKQLYTQRSDRMTEYFSSRSKFYGKQKTCGASEMSVFFCRLSQMLQKENRQWNMVLLPHFEFFHQQKSAQDQLKIEQEFMHGFDNCWESKQYIKNLYIMDNGPDLIEGSDDFLNFKALEYMYNKTLCPDKLITNPTSQRITAAIRENKEAGAIWTRKLTKRMCLKIIDHYTKGAKTELNTKNRKQFECILRNSSTVFDEDFSAMCCLKIVPGSKEFEDYLNSVFM